MRKAGLEEAQSGIKIAGRNFYDIVPDELGPVLELLHLPAIELLLLPVQVHHVRGLAPEPEDLHVLGVPVWWQVAGEFHFIPDMCQNGFLMAYHPDLL